MNKPERQEDEFFKHHIEPYKAPEEDPDEYLEAIIKTFFKQMKVKTWKKQIRV